MSKKLKLSQWHDGSVKPVHVGIYETKGNGYNEQIWSYFDGEIFNGRWSEKSSAFHERDFGEGCEVTKWRGIVK